MSSRDDELAAAQYAIIGFHQDDEGHWVAELECGHSQHMRHDPPWQNRDWVMTPEGRARFIGVRVECPLCVRPNDREGRAPRPGPGRPER